MINTDVFTSKDNITAAYINGLSANATNTSDNIHLILSAFRKYRRWAKIYAVTPAIDLLLTNRYNLTKPWQSAAYCGDFIMVPSYLIGVPCRIRFKVRSDLDNIATYYLKVGTLGSLDIDISGSATTTLQTIQRDFTPDRSMSISLMLHKNVMPDYKYAEITNVEFISQSEGI
jgi:hypothetical protein